VFAMYVLKSFADESLPLLKLVPFTRFETGVLAQSGHYDPSGLITTLGISLVGVGLCYMLYLRRDVHSV